MSETSKELLAVAARIGELPTMPDIISEVLSITDNPTSTMVEVSEALKRDPVLAAKVLSVSNSPYYGMRQRVASLKLALVILGVREVRNIVLAVSMFECLRDDSTEKFMGEAFRQHSASVAGLSKKLASCLGHNYHGEDFMAGLLHDIGKVVLWRQMRDEYEPILASAEGSAHELSRMERDALGFTHADASAAIARKWNLPTALVDALSYHHPHPEKNIEDANDPKLAALVRIANSAALEEADIDGNRFDEAVHDDQAWTVLDPEETHKDIAYRKDLLASFMTEVDTLAVPTF